MTDSAPRNLYPLRRRAGLVRCSVCYAPVLTGFDDDRCGVMRKLDPWPLSEIGEIAAIINGRQTAEIDRSRRIAARDHYRSWRLKSDRPVFADHKCGQPIPEAWRDEISPLQNSPPVLRDIPPF